LRDSNFKFKFFFEVAVDVKVIMCVTGL